MTVGLKRSCRRCPTLLARDNSHEFCSLCARYKSLAEGVKDVQAAARAVATVFANPLVHTDSRSYLRELDATLAALAIATGHQVPEMPMEWVYSDAFRAPRNAAVSAGDVLTNEKLLRWGRR